MKKFSLLLLLVAIRLSAQPTDAGASYTKYTLQNMALRASADPNRVVLMGDSITEAWAMADAGLFGKHNVNRGIAGQTTVQMLLRFREDVIDLRPKLVVIMGGTNDFALNQGPVTVTETFERIVAMVKLAKSHKIKVALCSVLPADHFNWRPEVQPAQKIIQLNKKLKSYAAHHKITYIDYHSNLKNAQNGMKPMYSQDGVHPNAKGYAVMKPLLLNGIAKALKSK